MSLANRRISDCFPLLAAALCVLAVSAQAATLTINLRSGNAASGNPDPLISRLDVASSCGVGAGGVFAASDFAAADAGPQAVVLAYIHPAWTTSLPCDPLAQWIGVAPTAAPMSTLFAMEFDLPADGCCYQKAELEFCWMADDGIGDALNPAGLYLNGSPIAAVAGGNFTTQTTVGGINILPYIKCGRNALYVYNRDIGCAVSGVNFSARLILDECITPAGASSWGRVKATYR